MKIRNTGKAIVLSRGREKITIPNGEVVDTAIGIIEATGATLNLKVRWPNKSRLEVKSLPRAGKEG